MTTAKTKTVRANAKTKAAPKTPDTFTTVQLAADHGMQAKTLRARIRRNIDKWEPLFVKGERHVFPAKARADADALLA